VRICIYLMHIESSPSRVAMKLTDSYAEAVARGYVQPRTSEPTTMPATTSSSPSSSGGSGGEVDTGISFGSAEFVAQEEMNR
jgi:uncharacterized membrane protein